MSRAEGARVLATGLGSMLAATFALGVLARADWPPAGTLVSTSAATDGHDHVRLFRDVLGDVLVVWRQHNLAGSTCAAQRVTATGSIADGWPVGGVGLKAFSYFDAAPDGAGGALAAYVSSGYDIYLERALGDASHVPPSGPGFPVADTSQTEWYSAVIRDDAEGAYVAWVRGLSRVYLKRILLDGSLAPGWPATGVAVAAEGPFSQQVALASPELLADGAGGVYVMWLSDDHGGPYGGPGARVQRFGSDGTVTPGWPASGLLLGQQQPELYSSPFLRLIPSGADHAIAAWVDHYSGTRLFLQRFHYSGTIDPAWPASGRLVLSTGEAISSITLVPDGQGGVTVLWDQNSLARMKHFTAAGLLPPGNIGSSPLDPGAQYVPGSLLAATGPDGGVIVSWTDTRQSPPGMRIRWFRADGSPEPAEPAAGRLITPGGTPATGRGLIEDGSGGAYAAWQDDTGGGVSSYLLRLSHAPGTAIVGVGAASEAGARLGLGPPAPNPAGAEFTVRFTLARDEPARIELLDIAGRTRRSLEVRGAGEQVARLGDLDRLPPGLYFVLLTQGAHARSTRVVIAH